MPHETDSGDVGRPNRVFAPVGVLARGCSNQTPIPNVDTDAFRSASAALGRFRCPVDHPSFRDAWPIPECIVVFPRTSVWIRHQGSRRFLADPSIATIYNRAQRYERSAASPDGDRCDWFAVSDALAREIAGAFEPAAALSSTLGS